MSSRIRDSGHIYSRHCRLTPVNMVECIQAPIAIGTEFDDPLAVQLRINKDRCIPLAHARQFHLTHGSRRNTCRLFFITRLSFWIHSSKHFNEISLCQHAE